MSNTMIRFSNKIIRLKRQCETHPKLGMLESGM